MTENEFTNNGTTFTHPGSTMYGMDDKDNIITALKKENDLLREEVYNLREKLRKRIER